MVQNLARESLNGLLRGNLLMRAGLEEHALQALKKQENQEFETFLNHVAGQFVNSHASLKKISEKEKKKLSKFFLSKKDAVSLEIKTFINNLTINSTANIPSTSPSIVIESLLESTLSLAKASIFLTTIASLPPLLIVKKDDASAALLSSSDKFLEDDELISWAVESMIEKDSEASVILTDSNVDDFHSEDEARNFMIDSDKGAPRLLIELCDKKAEVDDNGVQRCSFDLDKAVTLLIKCQQEKDKEGEK